MRLHQLELTEKELTIGQDSKDFWGSTNLVKSVYKYNKALIFEKHRAPYHAIT